MKNFTLLTVSGLCLWAVTPVLKAQEKGSPWTFGVKGGMNLSSSTLDNDGSKVGFNGGVTVEYDLGNRFFLHSGLEYTNKRFENETQDFFVSSPIPEEGDSYSSISSLTMNTVRISYLQLPLTIGYRLPVSRNANITFRGGAYVAWGLNSRTKGTTVQTEYLEDKQYHFVLYNNSNEYDNAQLQRLDYGLLGGVGFEYKRFFIDLNYELGLRNINKPDGNYSYASQTGKSYSRMNSELGWRNRNLTLSVGYKF